MGRMELSPCRLIVKVCIERREEFLIQFDLSTFEALPRPIGIRMGDGKIDPIGRYGVFLLVFEDSFKRRKYLVLLAIAALLRRSKTYADTTNVKEDGFWGFLTSHCGSLIRSRLARPEQEQT